MTEAMLLAILIGTLRRIVAGLSIALVVGVIVCQVLLFRGRHARRE
ncbi:MAG: hypothetical protein H0X42_01685 [Solirubrobacterales bacterium]|nr:hypothetical protein [Solirubrobacterales bacterium]